MAQLRLTLDLGNTSLKAVLWRGDDKVAATRLLHETPKLEPSFAKRAASCESAVAVASHGVRERRPPSLACLEAALAHGTKIAWVGVDLEPPGSVAYDDPRELGIDRRLAVLGARRDHETGLIVDCGTAVTLTHFDAALNIRPLAIGIGRAALERGIATSAPALAPFLGAALPQGLPRGTRDNLAIGVEIAFDAALRGLVADAEARLAAIGLPAAPLLLTGSDATRALRALSGALIVEDLVHRGLLALTLRR